MDKMQIVYCTDENYIEMAEMSAQTVLKHNQNCEITIISQKPIKTKYNNIIINLDKYELKESGYRLTKATYLRLFIPQYINKQKIIYLDCDTICRGSLEQLWNMNIDYIGICHNHNYGIEQAKQFKHQLYANDGMMLMNIKQLKNIQFTKKCLNNMNNINIKQWLCAETITNYLFYDKLTFVNTKYNFIFNRSYSKYTNQHTTLNDAIIIHFLGEDKSKFKDFFKKQLNKKGF